MGQAHRPFSRPRCPTAGRDIMKVRARWRRRRSALTSISMTELLSFAAVLAVVGVLLYAMRTHDFMALTFGLAGAVVVIAWLVFGPEAR